MEKLTRADVPDFTNLSLHRTISLHANRLSSYAEIITPQRIQLPGHQVDSSLAFQIYVALADNDLT